MDFGKIDDIDYKERRGIYGLSLNSTRDKLMVIRTPRGLFLPGGGLEDNEDHEICLKREFLEETGYEITLHDFICESSLYGISPRDNSYQKSVGTFYIVSIGNLKCSAKELDHEILWLDIHDALNTLKLQNQQWGVKQYIENFLNLKEKNNVWDKVAFRFGETGPRYWNQFGERLINFTELQEGINLLDIGMGRGASLFPGAKAIGPDGLATGIDLSEEMVIETAKDINRRDLKNIDVLQMDATKLDFDDNSFDTVINGFGFGYLVYTDDQFKEIKRVLKPHGIFSLCQWGEQKDQGWLTNIIEKYLPPAPRPASSDEVKTYKFQTKEDISNLLNTASFNNIQAIEETTDVIYKDKDQWWNEMWTNAVRGIFERVSNLENNALENFKRDIFSALDHFKEDRGYVFRMTVIYVKCSK